MSDPTGWRPSVPPIEDPGARANAHSARGARLAGEGRFREAVHEFRAALALVPGNPIALNNLAMTLGRAGALQSDRSQLSEAVDFLRGAIQIQPSAVGLYQNLAAVLALADRPVEALAALEEAVPLEPSNERTLGLRSLARLTLGDYDRGWDHFDPVLGNPAARAREIPGIPRWRGETMPGALLINGQEEGQGDCIQGIRFAAEARRRVGAVVALVPPSLARLVAHAPGLDRVETDRGRLPAVAAQVVPMDLAAVFQPKHETITGAAYLTADPATVDRWRPIVRAVPGLRVGIAWQGNPAFHLDTCRSFRLDEMGPLARVDGVSLISLQKGPAVAQRTAAGFPTTDLGPSYDAGDWLETAAVVHLLDLVITSDSALAHLAGALGTPVWVALARPADWRWLVDRDDSPWYRSMRLFRQKTPGEWGPVFQQIAEALAGMEARSRGRENTSII